MSKEAMKLALEALEGCEDVTADVLKAITALREALAEQPAQQEAQIVRWNCPCGNKYTFHGFTKAPAQRKPLTDEQIDRLWSQSLADTESETWLPLREFARAIEAAHGIKGDT